MTKVIEIKDKVIKFCGQYESYLKYVYRFIIAIILFLMITNAIGFMEKINSVPIMLGLALVCAIFPQEMTMLAAAVLVLLNLYVLSMEVALAALVVFCVIFLLYFRFAPHDGILFLLTPICWAMGIPYILPVAAGLLRKAYSAAAIVSGTVAYYFVYGVYENVTALQTATATAETKAQMSITVTQLLTNKEMFLMSGILAAATIVVYMIRKQAVDHAWMIAIISGIFVQVAAAFAGYLIFDISGKEISLVVGSLVSLLLGFVIEFCFMNLDYGRTERVQFEDDEYYYFVKAIPKKMVASTDKSITEYSAYDGFKVRRKAKKEAEEKRVTRKSVVEELDIDEEFFK